MKKYLTVLPLLAVALLSCTKEVSPEISTDIFSRQTDSQGCEFSVKIRSNAPWVAECSNSEVTISPKGGIGNGEAVIKVPQYLGRATNMIRVIFKAYNGENSVSSSFVAITQESLPFLYCDDSEQTVSSDATFAIFSVNSNFEWSVKETSFSGDDFDLRIEPSVWQQNRVEVLCTFPENLTGKERRADIVLALTDYPAVTTTLKLVQQK